MEPTLSMPDRPARRRRRSRRTVRSLLIALSAVTLLSVLTPAASVATDEDFIRGAFGPDGSESGYDNIAAAGFNTINSSAYKETLDEVAAAGLKATVWLGPYEHDTCSFGKSDDWVRERLGEVAGHPAIVAYYLDDEPARARITGCTDVAQQVRERSELVKSLDPSKPTYVTLAAGDGEESYPYQYFADTADIVGLVVYPCNNDNGCGFDHINRAIAEAEADGIDRYWAIIQSFGNDWYQYPSYAEIRRQLEVWEDSQMEGFFLYDWSGLEGFTPAQLRALDSRFVDVPRGSLFYWNINWTASEEISRGCNPPLNDRYCPDDLVTRGQMAAFLVRAFGYTEGGSGDSFVDDDGSVFEGDIEKIRAAGVTAGCNPPDNDRFCPDAPVTRGQMAAFLVRAFGYTDGDSGDPFVDDDGSMFEGDIEKIRAAGVTAGCNPPVNDRFCPDAPVTRGQMAAFLYRALT